MNTNPENYKWGIFYFNRGDQRIFVPKMISKMGWTLNFARPESYIIIAAFFVVIYLVSHVLNKK
jgi:uncharacterized membrane protein